MERLKKYWFLTGLFIVCLLTVADHFEILARAGLWLKQHHGPDTIIVLIFFFSGIALSIDQLRAGLMDLKGVVLALILIFLVSPLIAAVFGFLPLPTGVLIGLFLVAAMPTTLSSGVVMTGAAGGNAAHALMITISANMLAVFTIPYALSFLLMRIGASASIEIDKAAIMTKIALLVVLPLIAGLAAKMQFPQVYRRFGSKMNLVNQCLILTIVWIALSQTRDMLIHSGMTLAVVIMIGFGFHGLLLLAGWTLISISQRPRGRRESILFMGGQKTLPLSVILQVTLFPQYGVALLVCVIHHIVHLAMDGYLVERLKA